MKLYRIPKNVTAHARKNLDFCIQDNVLIPVEPDATWFTIENPDDPMFIELWARGIVKAVPVDEEER